MNSTGSPFHEELLRRCDADDVPTRDAVLRELRADATLVKEIACEDAPSARGSLITLKHFTKHGRWPDEDKGWIREATGLCRWGYWFESDEERVRFHREHGGRRTRSPPTAARTTADAADTLLLCVVRRL